MQRRTFLASLAASVGGLAASADTAVTADSGLSCGDWYDGEITDVVDGDTFGVHVYANDTAYEVRTIGHDTPEKSGNTRFERTEEWEFIEDATHLEEWGNRATDFAEAELPVGTACQIALDCASEEVDRYGRLLARVRYDRDGDGSMDTVWNELTLEAGYARVYAASTSDTDQYLGLQEAARADGRGVWSADDGAAPEWRNDAVAGSFHPHASSIRTTDGRLPGPRTPVWAEPEAVQENTTSHTVGYERGAIPLVGVDEANNLAYFGGVPINERWEAESAALQHFVFVTNLIDYLHDSSDPSGPVLVDGGHHTFEQDNAVSAEDVAFYQRYLEGVGVELHSINTYGDATGYSLSDARALVASCSPDGWTASEVSAVRSFLDDGGVLLLMGSGSERAVERANLDGLAADLGSDLRLNEDDVRDDENNVGTRELLQTANLNTADFQLWSAYDGSGGGPDDAAIEFGAVNQYPHATRNEEYVDVTNAGSSDRDMTGYTLENGDGDAYAFPDGFTLTAGGTARVHTGDGTDSSADGDLYWGAPMFRWDNDGDTAAIYDDGGALVRETSWAFADVVIPALDAENEWVDVRNVGDSSVDMTGWSVKDEASHAYEFPGGFSLGAGDTVRLHTGDGVDTGTDLYWGSGTAVWNDGGDTCSLYNDANDLVQQYAYPAPYSLSVPGTSLSGDTLNDEWVDVENEGASPLDMSDYALADEAGHTYVFPDSFTLHAGSTVRVHTGDGTDTATDLYWGRASAVWNDDGDTASVYDDNERLAAKRRSEDFGGATDVLDAAPDAANTGSYHTWTLADASDGFTGEVDSITVDYPSGTSLDGLTEADVTVSIDRDGDGTVDEIRVNADEYSGSTGTFDLDGRYDTSVAGEVRVEIDGVRNPGAGDYVATETLAGDDAHSVDAQFVVE